MNHSADPLKKSEEPPTMPTIQEPQKLESLNTLRSRAKSNGQPSVSASAVRHAIQDILYDLMYSGDIAAAVDSINKNKMIDGIEFCKRALIFGIERQPYERELISRLLSACYEIFNDNEIVDGFQIILFRLPDIVLDVPHAPLILSKFLSRAVYDEIVPPVFIKDATIDNAKAKECMALTFGTTHSVDGKESMEHIWGPGDLTSVTSLKIEIDTLLEEYLDNPDIKETTDAIIELNVPSFFGEVVKRGLFKCLDKSEDSWDTFIKLLQNWFEMNLISDDLINRGFSMAFSRINEIKIDVPNAESFLVEIQKKAVIANILQSNFEIPVLQEK